MIPMMIYDNVDESCDNDDDNDYIDDTDDIIIMILSMNVRMKLMMIRITFIEPIL